MDGTLDQTTLSTIDLLEARLLRVEHVLYGSTASHPPARQHESVTERMAELEKRFAVLLSHIRVYDELLKIYKSSPDLFHTPAPSQPPSQLSLEAVRAIVMASASMYPATLSALTAVKDCAVPDSSESIALVSMKDRLRAIHATQLAQESEAAELRHRSETLVRSWYEKALLADSLFTADMESRVGKVERHVRRKERSVEEQKHF